MAGGWRSGARRTLPWLVTAGSGFLLGYLLVYLFVLPAPVLPTDRPVPDAPVDGAFAARLRRAA